MTERLHSTACGRGAVTRRHRGPPLESPVWTCPDPENTRHSTARFLTPRQPQGDQRLWSPSLRASSRCNHDWRSVKRRSLRYRSLHPFELSSRLRSVPSRSHPRSFPLSREACARRRSRALESLHSIVDCMTPAGCGADRNAHPIATDANGPCTPGVGHRDGVLGASQRGA
jgi:hypothetical protein